MTVNARPVLPLSGIGARALFPLMKKDSMQTRMKRQICSLSAALALTATASFATAPGAYASDCAPIDLDLRVFLTESSVVGASGYATESDAPFPTDQPFTGAGVVLRGGEGATTSGIESVVDWVLIQLRDPNSPETVLATDAVPVLTDGSLQRSAAFAVPEGNYLVAVQTRNHLGIMTETPIPLTSTAPAVDFTDPTLAIWTDGSFSSEPRVYLGSQLSLWPGDVDGDGEVGAADVARVESDFSSGLLGYQISDIDLDGEVGAADVALVKRAFVEGPFGFLPANSHLSETPLECSSPPITPTDPTTTPTETTGTAAAVQSLAATGGSISGLIALAASLVAGAGVLSVLARRRTEEAKRPSRS